MGTLLSALLLISLLCAWREKPFGWFVTLSLTTIAALSWLFYSDITQPLHLSF